MLGSSGGGREEPKVGEFPSRVGLALLVYLCLSPGGSQVLRKVVTTPQSPTRPSTPTALPQPLKPAPQALAVSPPAPASRFQVKPKNLAGPMPGHLHPGPLCDSCDPGDPQPIPCACLLLAVSLRESSVVYSLGPHPGPWTKPGWYKSQLCGVISSRGCPDKDP